MKAKYYVVYEKAGEHKTEFAVDSDHLAEMVAECKKLCFKIIEVHDG